MISSPKRKKLIKRRQADVVGALPSHFVNRELSWLEFNRRVLSEAVDGVHPLLERVKFLSIFLSNLDEFFMKRVGGIKQQIAAGVMHQTPDGMTPQQEYAAIRPAVTPMLQLATSKWLTSLKQELSENGIKVLKWGELTDTERVFLNRYFSTHVFPTLTPLAVDPGHPFPFLSNLSTSLGIVLYHPDNKAEKIFARVKIPEILPQLVRVNEPAESSEYRCISLVEIIIHHLHALFPGMVVDKATPFRITRNAEVELDALDADDLLDLIQEELRERKFAKVLRLEHGPNPDPWMINILAGELELSESDIYETLPLEDAAILKGISELNFSKLKFDPWIPVPVTALGDEETNIFASIRHHDVLVHHPFESFASSVEKFVRSAAEDPRVVAIKATLYRTGEDSSIVPWLLRAAEAGKQVVCVIELKAHFDEARNIKWARAMENAGVHVIYGLLGLKTHAKVLMVVREEADGMRCYGHIGTGNYHSQTANAYTDLGLFTASPTITHDLSEVFNFLTGKSLKREYSNLLVAPFNMKEKFLNLIAREAEHAKAGKAAHIIAKMNSLEDHGICRALYEASQVGVKIELFIRGLCVLRPAIPGVSENISVYSILGRFLEHSRIFYFRNAQFSESDGDLFIGSADWMYRNLLNRVEVIVPIEDGAIKKRLWEVLSTMRSDFVQTWKLQNDGSYIRRKIDPASTDTSNQGTQITFMQRAIQNRGFA